jgi:hypothetical protein
MEKRIIEGKATIAMTGEVNGICDPYDNQLHMF